MSGVEVAGLVLGTFPLIISAMEHYEDTKKVAAKWWRIKHAHRSDMRKIKDCQLKFKLNLKELLLPLVVEGVVNQGEYERLLADPGGEGWREDHVEDALRERLSECHERYIETLEEILETMTQLSKECRVDDAQFQASLAAKNEKHSSTPQAQQAQMTLMLKANVAFEAKRIQYSFTGAKRDELLARIDKHNDRLQDVLATNDRIAAQIQGIRTTAARRPNPKSLSFWLHAASIFQLLNSVWNCQCRSRIGLWLQHRSFHEISMRMHMKLCKGHQCFQWRLTDTTPTLQLGQSRPGTQSPCPLTAVIIHSGASTSTAAGSIFGSNVALTTSSATPHTSSMPGSGRLEAEGLCKTSSAIHPTQQPDLCLGRLNDGANEYAVYPVTEKVPGHKATSLADLLKPGSKLRLTRVQRYGIALTLASSHLQLHSTPWLKEPWTSEDVYFPTCSDKSVLSFHDEPYIFVKFGSGKSNVSNHEQDRSFSTLGIVLLELCFGTRLEEHRLWQDPAFAPGISNEMIRQAVAVNWLKEVQGEAGEDYNTAVDWTLRQAPAVIKDNKWRADFAQNVVQPLQRQCDYLAPQRMKN